MVQRIEKGEKSKKIKWNGMGKTNGNYFVEINMKYSNIHSKIMILERVFCCKAFIGNKHEIM